MKRGQKEKQMCTDNQVTQIIFPNISKKANCIKCSITNLRERVMKGSIKINLSQKSSFRDQVFFHEPYKL